MLIGCKWSMGMFLAVENRTFSDSGQGTRKTNKTGNSDIVCGRNSNLGNQIYIYTYKKTRTNEKQQNSSTEVCGWSSPPFFLVKQKKTKANNPQYYSPLHDAHGVRRANTTSFTFESSVSSQEPLPLRRTQWGCVGVGVGRWRRRGGCTGLGGQRHSHTQPSQRERERGRAATQCSSSSYYYYYYYF